MPEPALRELASRMLAELQDKSLDQFRRLAEGLPVIAWAARRNGTRELFNHHYADFLGLDPGQATGREGACRPFIHRDDVGFYLTLFKLSIRRKRPFKAEFRGLRTDGRWRWIKSAGPPCWGSDGEYLGHVGASLDVTEREEPVREPTCFEAIMPR